MLFPFVDQLHVQAPQAVVAASGAGPLYVHLAGEWRGASR